MKATTEAPIVDRVLDIVRQHSGRITGIEISMMLGFIRPDGRSKPNGVAPFVSLLVKQGRIEYGPIADWDVPGYRKNIRRSSLIFVKQQTTPPVTEKQKLKEEQINKRSRDFYANQFPLVSSIFALAQGHYLNGKL